MKQVIERETYNVEFLLSFKGEERGYPHHPYHDQRTFELDKSKIEGDKKAEELKKQLTEVVRNYFAGINEFPVELVLVELVKFERSKETA